MNNNNQHHLTLQQQQHQQLQQQQHMHSIQQQHHNQNQRQTLASLLRTSAVASGYLGKLSSSDATGMPFWKKRFICLAVDGVYAFRTSDHDQVSVGRLVLDESSQAFVCEHGIWVVEVRTALRPTPPSSADTNADAQYRTWTLQCSSKEDMVQWLGHFRRTIAYIKSLAATAALNPRNPNPTQSTSQLPARPVVQEFSHSRSMSATSPSYPSPPSSTVSSSSATYPSSPSFSQKTRSATTRTVQPRRNNPIASLEPVLALLDQLELAHQHPPSPTLPMNASSASLSSLNKRPESPSSSIASTLTNQSPAMASLGERRMSTVGENGARLLTPYTEMTFEIKGAYGSKTGLFGGWGGSSASASAA